MRVFPDHCARHVCRRVGFSQGFIRHIPAARDEKKNVYNNDDKKTYYTIHEEVPLYTHLYIYIYLRVQ